MYGKIQPSWFHTTPFHLRLLLKKEQPTISFIFLWIVSYWEKQKLRVAVALQFSLSEKCSNYWLQTQRMICTKFPTNLKVVDWNFSGRVQAGNFRKLYIWNLNIGKTTETIEFSGIPGISWKVLLPKSGLQFYSLHNFNLKTVISIKFCRVIFQGRCQATSWRKASFNIALYQK